jgi:hypothetical protein
MIKLDKYFLSNMFILWIMDESFEMELMCFGEQPIQ